MEGKINAKLSEDLNICKKKMTAWRALKYMANMEVTMQLIFLHQGDILLRRRFGSFVTQHQLMWLRLSESVEDCTWIPLEMIQLSYTNVHTCNCTSCSNCTHLANIYVLLRAYVQIDTDTDQNPVLIYVEVLVTHVCFPFEFV